MTIFDFNNALFSAPDDFTAKLLTALKTVQQIDNEGLAQSPEYEIESYCKRLAQILQLPDVHFSECTNVRLVYSFVGRTIKKLYIPDDYWANTKDFSITSNHARLVWMSEAIAAIEDYLEIHYKPL